MKQLEHIEKNKELLELRFQIIRLIREFFWEQNFLEVETPNLVKLPGQEPYLSPMKLNIRDESGKEYSGFLHTSPEYGMKKMLASGFENIFSICKCYRDHESFGGEHNPEFTMIEWYRTNENFYKIMEDVERLIEHLAKKVISDFRFQISDFERIHMRDLWKEYVGVNLDDYLTTEAMYQLCKDKGYNVQLDESYENLFYRIFLNEIEPKINNQKSEIKNLKSKIFIIHHYPAQMAALSRLSEDDPRYAERFEVYINGIEIANAFSELTDGQEQKKRLEEERALRKKLGNDVFDIDEDFVEAVGKMPPCAGIALGVDRLVQTFAHCKNLDDVLVLPASKLF